MLNTRPFPFWGESFSNADAGFVTVRFMYAPSEEQIYQIIAIAPPEIAPERENFCGKMLTTGKSYFYSDPKIDKKIENWLMSVHEFCPIQFVCRSAEYPHYFAEEEIYSEWHVESEKIANTFTDDLLKEKDLLEQLPKEKVFFAKAFKLIPNDIKLEDLPEKIFSYFYPIYYISELIGDNKIDIAVQLFNNLIKSDYFKTTSPAENLASSLDSFFYLNDKNRLKNFVAFSILILQPEKNRSLFFEVDLSYVEGTLKNLLKAASLELNDTLTNIIIEEANHPDRFFEIMKAAGDVASSFIHEKEEIHAKNYILKTFDKILNIALAKEENAVISIIKNQPHSDKKIFNIIKTLGDFSIKFIHYKEYEFAIRLFDLALGLNKENDKKKTFLLTYYNALPALESSNNQLPVDKERNNKFLAKCLPFAPKNPMIYYNASCLYMEMDEINKAFECIEELENYQFKERDKIIDSIKTRDLFKVFREDKRYKQLFFNKK